MKEYNPYVVELNDSEVLISIFLDDDGEISLVEYAERQYSWQTWSPPTEARPA